jgi:phosphoglucosamine mutase
VVLIDEQGQLVDGDQVLALITRSWAAEGRVPAAASSPR